MTIVLASASPRRAELLAVAGYGFTVRVSEVDERLRAAERPDDYVRRLASAKSESAHDPAAPDTVTLGADTAVVVDGMVLGKPAGDAEAAAMLRRLSGRAHEVLTGVSLRMGRREVTEVARTVVEFSSLSVEDITWYVESGEGRDKAGGYAIQGLGSRFIPRIEGSYSNVVGLPMATFTTLLRALTEPR
jgi:septum formation protein